MTDKTESERVLEDIFGEVEDDMFTEESAPQSEPDKEEAAPAVEAKPQDNEEVRYQYWQSEADKRANELAKAKAEAEYYKMLASKESEQAAQQEESFPPPPMAPRVPAGYNVEEAMQDPRSASAQYVAEYQQWQQNMLEYSVARTEYLEAIIRERDEVNTKEREKRSREDAERQAYETSLSQVERDVMTKYGVGQDVAKDFIDKMSKPESLSIENLWAMYDVVYRKKQKAPSPSFQQAKRAGSFAPSGVASQGGQPSEGRSAEDILMDGFKAIEEKDNW